MLVSEFDKTIGLIEKCLNFIGLWPMRERNTLAVIKFYTSAFLCFFFLIIPQSAKLFIVKNNLNDIIEVLLTGLVPILVAFYKLYNGWYNRQGDNHYFIVLHEFDIIWSYLPSYFRVFLSLSLKFFIFSRVNYLNAYILEYTTIIDSISNRKFRLKNHFLCLKPATAPNSNVH